MNQKNKMNTVGIVAIVIALTIITGISFAETVKPITKPSTQPEKTANKTTTRPAKSESSVRPKYQIPNKRKTGYMVNLAKKQARIRMRQDAKKYTKDQRRDIESTYQVANKNWKKDRNKARKSLEKLVGQYKHANRTGCAVLYLGQLSRDEKQKVKYFKQAIKDFSDCYYGNGVNVGANAKLYLASLYINKGRYKQAEKLLNEIVRKHRTAVTHSGKAMIEFVDELYFAIDNPIKQKTK